ncbi:hypothetical protein BKA70DRAFT_1448185 [Coprinopsis sp. MPI-PUGE-AT-0042]|nr:hypothetical protein BKA70DRAFT_1448185 [Coprinopsis sp. MPI-PUGE-AT-0042]
MAEPTNNSLTPPSLNMADQRVSGVGDSRWASGHGGLQQAIDREGNVNMERPGNVAGGTRAPYPTPSSLTPVGTPRQADTTSSTSAPSFFPAAAGGFVHALVDAVGRIVDSRLSPLEKQLGTLQKTVEEGTLNRNMNPPQTPWRGRRNNDDDDADDEAEVQESPRKRRERESNPLLNRYNKHFRSFLKGPKVKLDLTKPPAPPEAQVLDAFNIRGVGGPSLPVPQFAFQEPITSPWNQELVELIVQELLPTLRQLQHAHEASGEDLYPDEYLTKDFAIERLHIKLKHTFAAYRKTLPPPPFSPETPEAKQQRLEEEGALRKRFNRRSNRRRNLHAQRMDTVQSYILKDPEVWVKVLKVLSDLGPDAMSSDESGPETTGRYNPKVFWRVPKPWLSPSITALMQGIDAQPLKRKPGVSARHRTSPPAQHVRTHNEVLDAHNMAYVGELPSNWYNPMFLSSLRPIALQNLAVKDEVEVPRLTPGASTSTATV